MTRARRQYIRLGLLRALARIFPAPAPKSASLSRAKTTPPPATRILVIRPDHLGDLLFVTPALRVLRQQNPDAQITALVGPWGVPVLRDCPSVDVVIALPFPGFVRKPKPSFWQPYQLLWQWAHSFSGRYDRAYVFRFDHWWGAALAYLARVPERIGYNVAEVAPFLSFAAPYIAGRHEVEQNLNLIDLSLLDDRQSTDSLGSTRAARFPLEFHIPQDASICANAVVEHRQPIAIHPGAGAAVKLWRKEAWAAIADALHNEIGAPILLTGSTAEQQLCTEIRAHMSADAQVMAGKTTFGQLAALFAKCRLVLGVDSGPLHLATAVGTPTVHLYGPVDTATFGPWGRPEKHRALVSDWPCVPCNRLDYGPNELGDHPCVREISINSVLAAARGALMP